MPSARSTASRGSVRERLLESIARGRERHALTRNLVLPPLIASPEEVFAFHLPPSQPNFITRKCVTAPVASIADPPESFAGRILFVPSADPGFDWIFTRGICGIRHAVRRRQLAHGDPRQRARHSRRDWRRRGAVQSLAERAQAVPRLHQSEGARRSHEDRCHHPAGCRDPRVRRAPRLPRSGLAPIPARLRAPAAADAERGGRGARAVPRERSRGPRAHGRQRSRGRGRRCTGARRDRERAASMRPNRAACRCSPCAAACS